MRIVFFGTGDFAVPALRALLEAENVIVAAVTQPDRPAGRGRVIVPTAVHAAADHLGIRHIPTEDVNSRDILELCAGADMGVVAAFGQKMGAALLKALPRGCVNIHGSLLPKYRGAAPYQWAILNGETETGVTVFQLDERWDAGPIWGQRAIPIGETETADELHDRLAVTGAQLVVDTLRDIASGAAQPQPQDVSHATRAPKLTKADAAVDFSQAAARVVRRIHGLWSWPAAACTFASHTGKHERVQLARARVADATPLPTPDVLPGAFCSDGTLQTGQGRILLLEVKPAGGKLMPFDAFARGRRIVPPDRLLPPEPA